MVLAYFDIETYSPQKEPLFTDKVILICIKEVGKKEKMFKEWESSEKDILKEFYSFIKEKVEKETLTLIGWNIARFDIPFLTYRINFHKIAKLEEIFEVFRKCYWRDLRLCFLPFNKLKFKGLNERVVAEKLGVRKPKYSNKEIKEFYEKGEYNKIEEHTLSEIDFLSDISWKLIKDIKEVLRCFNE